MKMLIILVSILAFNASANEVKLENLLGLKEVTIINYEDDSTFEMFSKVEFINKTLSLSSIGLTIDNINSKENSLELPLGNHVFLWAEVPVISTFKYKKSSLIIDLKREVSKTLFMTIEIPLKNVNKKMIPISIDSDYLDVPREYFNKEFKDNIDYINDKDTYLRTNQLSKESKLKKISEGVIQVGINGLYDNGNMGTAFCIDNDYLITNYHVLAEGTNSNKINIDLNHLSEDDYVGTKYKLTAIFRSSKYDFILARFKNKDNNPCLDKSLSISFEELNEEELISSIGFPGLLNGEQAISFGRLKKEEASKVGTNILANVGSSGSPILDNDGQVIGYINSTRFKKGTPITGGYSLSEMNNIFPINEIIYGNLLSEIKRNITLLESDKITVDQKLKMLDEYKNNKTLYMANRLKSLMITSSDFEVRLKIMEVLESINVIKR